MATAQKLSREEFVEAYSKRSGKSPEALRATYIPLPCECDMDGCEGWAMIRAFNFWDHYEMLSDSAKKLSESLLNAEAVAMIRADGFQWLRPEAVLALDSLLARVAA